MSAHTTTAMLDTPAASIESIIFDLDGTLVDSLPGIRYSLEESVRSCNLELAIPELRHVIGPPIAEMLPRMWPQIPDTILKQVLAQFRWHYDSVGCLKTQLFPGVVEGLERLTRSGRSLYILTNKPFAPTVAILEHLRIYRFFTKVVSPDSQNPPFQSKSSAARALKNGERLNSGSTLLIGDSADDAAAAADCGFKFVRAAYGYGNVYAGQWKIDAFTELETNILNGN